MWSSTPYNPWKIEIINSKCVEKISVASFTGTATVVCIILRIDALFDIIVFHNSEYGRLIPSATSLFNSFSIVSLSFTYFKSATHTNSSLSLSSPSPCLVLNQFEECSHFCLQRQLHPPPPQTKLQRPGSWWKDAQFNPLHENCPHSISRKLRIKFN